MKILNNQEFVQTLLSDDIDDSLFLYRKADYLSAYSSYLKDHKYCPQCGCLFYTTTLMAFMIPDHNRCSCNCGWRGITHDRVGVAPKVCGCEYCKLGKREVEEWQDFWFNHKE